MIRSLAIFVGTAAALAVSLPSAFADELTSVYAKIVADPTNSELNLQYAMIAEGRHEYRKALAAYERVLVNDPTNEAAKRGLQRVRRIIEPATTQKTFEIGTTWESNAPRLPDADSDVFGYANFRIKDERAMGGYRWRTNASLYGEAYGEHDELNYANANADIGPILDLVGTSMDFRPAVGVGAAYFDHSFYYWDVNASGLFEGYLNGAYQWLRFRVGYRNYDPSFTSGEGAYADVTGRFTLQDVFHERDALSLSPWARWSGIDGLPDNGATDFATGQYVEGGATLEYAQAFTDWLSGSINVKVGDRVYDDIGSGSRRDLLVSPGASLVFHDLLGPQTDVRLDYKYEWNHSNMVDHTWQNQAATIAFVIRR